MHSRQIGYLPARELNPVLAWPWGDVVCIPRFVSPVVVRGVLVGARLLSAALVRNRGKMMLRTVMNALDRFVAICRDRVIRTGRPNLEPSLFLPSAGWAPKLAR